MTGHNQSSAVIQFLSFSMTVTMTITITDCKRLWSGYLHISYSYFPVIDRSYDLTLRHYCHLECAMDCLHRDVFHKGVLNALVDLNSSIGFSSLDESDSMANGGSRPS